ncbi:MAG: hypothetical protein RQM90_11860 [Methanoculleus sp.]
MHLPNPLQLNDWDNRRLFWTLQALQITLIVVVCLDLIGYHIPIAREALAFLYVTFLPGVLVLKALRLHGLGTIETVLYSVGLSLAVLMFTGLAANIIYPLLGYMRPFSLEALFPLLIAVVQALLVLALTRDREYSDPDPPVSIIPPAPAVPLLALLPFLAIIGAYVRNEHHMVTYLFLLLVLIAVIGLAIGFDRFIPPSCYPLAVYTIALSLLYHTSLISGYVWGYDIHHELHLVNGVLGSGLWDASIPYNTNAMLSVVVLVLHLLSHHGHGPCLDLQDSLPTPLCTRAARSLPHLCEADQCKDRVPRGLLLCRILHVLHRDDLARSPADR